MKSLFYILFFFFFCINIQAQTTAPKELESQTEKEINYKEIFSIAKENITDAVKDKEKVSQYKWYRELLPFRYRVLLYTWMMKKFPEYKYSIKE